MTRRRWIADEVSGSRAALIGPHSDHLSRVLRAEVGQEFDIATGQVVRRGRIVKIETGRVEFELGEPVATPEVPRVTLVLSIFKFDRMEWAIEKVTELGVARIVPLIARRTESHLATASVKRVERWRRIAREAAQQSRRLAPPDISDPMKLKEAADLPGKLRILLSEEEQEIALKDLSVRSPGAEAALAIGPEGGWTEEEIASFRAAGWVSVSLGSTILRAETAAIAATAVLLSELYS